MPAPSDAQYPDADRTASTDGALAPGGPGGDPSGGPVRSGAAPVPGVGRRPERVRVVLADAARARRGGRVRTELTEQSRVGEALVRGLVRTQLGLALRLSAVVAVGLGGLPLLFAVAPALAAMRPFGIALPWLLLGVVAYPFLFAVGATYVWLSERTEAEFADLVDRR